MVYVPKKNLLNEVLGRYVDDFLFCATPKFLLESVRLKFETYAEAIC